MAIIELNESNFKETIDSNNIVIIDFWAPWCGPCKTFAPIYEEVSNEINDVVFAKVNTEDENELAVNFQIRSIPTLMIFREQIQIFLQAGALTKSDLGTILTKAQTLDMNKVKKEIDKNT